MLTQLGSDRVPNDDVERRLVAELASGARARGALVVH